MGIGDLFEEYLPIKVACKTCNSLKKRLNKMTPEEVREDWEEITLQMAVNAKRTIYAAIPSARIRKKLAGLHLARVLRMYENN